VARSTRVFADKEAKEVKNGATRPKRDFFHYEGKTYRFGYRTDGVEWEVREVEWGEEEKG
jgi:hypothetical protein